MNAIVTIKKDDIILSLYYDDKGVLQFVRNGENYVMISFIQEGLGYNFNPPLNGFGIVTEEQCDARYVYLPDYEIYIPKYLYITKPK
jgi:hypothetical protein